MAVDGAVAAPEAEVQVEQGQALVPADSALPGEPIAGDPALAAPADADAVVLTQSPVAPGAPVALAYPDIPSAAGLTPGAPLGSDAITDRKVVAGEAPRTIGAEPLLR